MGLERNLTFLIFSRELDYDSSWVVGHNEAMGENGQKFPVPTFSLHV